MNKQEYFLNSWAVKDALSRLTYKDGKLYRYGKPMPSYVDGDGYLVVKLAGRSFKQHRVIWYMHHKEWPNGDIDHINQDKQDNSIDNLRVVSKSLNSHNIRQSNKGSKSGYRGVYPLKGKWAAKIEVAGERIYLGVYNTPEEAHDAYLKAKKDKVKHDDADNQGA